MAEPEGADFVVINTCGFIGDARDESHAVIREMLRLKQQGRVGGVIVAGCLAERDGKSLLAKYPDIDQLVGVFARDQIGPPPSGFSYPVAAKSFAWRRIRIAWRRCGERGRASSAISTGADAAAGGHPSAADHAATPGFPEDRRRMQSLVQFLLDPQHPRGVCEQADRASGRRGRGTGRRRRRRN